MFRARSLLALLAWTTCASIAHAGVLVVGNGPGATHAGIQAAVDAAQDGDFVLVRRGTYASFVVRNLDLTIAAMPGAAVVIDGAIRVSGIDATRVLLLSGLRATGRFTSNPQSSFGLFARNCAGALRVQDCQLIAGVGQGPCGLRADGVYLEDCADVVLTRCMMKGASEFFDWDPHYDPWPPDNSGSGMGLFSTSSSLALYACQCIGGRGEIGAFYNCTGYIGPNGESGGGGEGARLTDSSIFASLTTFTGGAGGDGLGFAIACFYAGRGGDGLNVSSSPGGLLTGCMATGGLHGTPGGLPTPCASYHGPNGVGVRATPGSEPAVLPTPVRQLLAPVIVRDGSVATFQFLGAPGEQVGLLVTSRTRSRWMRSAFGVRVPLEAPPMTPIVVGVVPANGVLQQSWAIPLLPTGEQAQRLFVQPVFVSASGASVLGTPQALVVVDHTL